MLWCVVGTHAWADAKLDCQQHEDRDCQLDGCTRYIEENQTNRRELAVAYFFRAAAYMHKGDKDLAIADLTKVIEHSPKNAAAHHMRGLVHLNRREYDRVIPDFTKAIELEPNADDRVLAGRHMLRGIAYEKTGNADLAIADFRRALAIDPDQQGSKDGLRRLGATP